MPATAQRNEKQSRMDLRLTQSQRANYERAASLRGQTLTQWATAHLDENAQKDIDAAMSTNLSQRAFGEFCKMLEEPMPQEALDLLARKAVWE